MHDAATEQLPRNGAARKKLQEKGQFWTPDWIADAMVAWAANGADHIFDPAVGPGAFFRAGKRFFDRKQIHGRLIGCEVDRAVLESSLAQGLDTDDVKSVTVGDFMCESYQRRFKAIVANPPYLRHHRFTAEYKTTLRIFSSRTTGQDIDGRAGLHVFFLIKALTLLERGGAWRLSYRQIFVKGDSHQAFGNGSNTISASKVQSRSRPMRRHFQEWTQMPFCS